MKSVIKLNGKVAENSIITVDTLNNEVTFETMDSLFNHGWRHLDTDKTYVEVNIFGDID